MRPFLLNISTTGTVLSIVTDLWLFVVFHFFLFLLNFSQFPFLWRFTHSVQLVREVYGETCMLLAMVGKLVKQFIEGRTQKPNSTQQFTRYIVMPRPFQKAPIFLERKRKIEKGLEKFAYRDKLALTEISAGGLRYQWQIEIRPRI